MLCLAVGRTARGAKRIILAVRTGAFRSHVIENSHRSKFSNSNQSYVLLARLSIGTKPQGHRHLTPSNYPEYQLDLSQNYPKISRREIFLHTMSTYHIKRSARVSLADKR